MGSGAATVDALYAAVAVGLGAVLAPLIMAVGTPLRWLAAAVLVGVAIRLLLVGLPTRSDGTAAARCAEPTPRVPTVFMITL